MNQERVASRGDAAGCTGPDLIQANVSQWSRLAGHVECTFPLSEVDVVAVGRDSRVLDYGCGDGRMLTHLAAKGFSDLSGWDPSERMARLARASCRSAAVLSGGDPRQPPFSGASFDVVLIVAVLSSVVPHAERLRLVAGASELLRSDGLLIVGDFGCSTAPPYPDRYCSSVIEPGTFTSAEGLLVHHFLPAELRGLARAADLIGVRERSGGARTIHGRYVPAHLVYARNCRRGP